VVVVCDTWAHANGAANPNAMHSMTLFIFLFLIVVIVIQVRFPSARWT